MKNKKLIIILIVVLTIICISLITLMVNVLNGKFKFTSLRFSNVSNELIIDETYKNEFTKINISTDASDIYIKNTTEKNVKVKIYGDKDNTTISSDNNELKITTKSKPCFGICFNQQISKVEIYLPKEYSNEISIINKYGNIEIDEFINSNINIEEDCGNVIIKSANTITAYNDYGNIEIGEVNDANIEASAGNIEIKKVYNLTVINDYGNIDVENVLNYINAEADCGEVNIDNININENSKIVNDLGNIKIGKTNEIYIDAKTELGNVKINNNYQKSNITLKIENDCGDIKANN